MTTSSASGKTLLQIMLLWFAGLTAAAQFAKLSLTFSHLQEIYPDSDGSLSLLVSLIGFVGIILGLFAGLMASRFGYKSTLLVGLAIGTVCSLLQSTLMPLELMIAVRIVEGISHLAIVVATPTLLVQTGKPEHSKYIMVLWSTFFGVSFALTSYLGLPMIERFGLSSIFIVHAVCMLLALFAVWKFIPDVKSGNSDELQLNLPQIAKAHARAYRSPFISAPAYGWLFYTMTFVSVLTALPFLLPENQVPLAAGVLPLISIGSSILCGSFLIRFIPVVNILIFAFLAAAMTISSLLFQSQVFQTLLIFYFLLGILQSSGFALIPDLNPVASDQAQANGSLAQMGNLGNTIGTPLLILIHSLFGTNGMFISLAIIFLSGATVHTVLLQLRRKMVAKVA